MALEDKVTICSKCKMQWLYKPNELPIRTTCSRCMFLIQRISKDRDFLNAMIELQKNDIIEYQTKISQFRSQAKADGCYDKPTDKNVPKCPTCGSTNIEKISVGKKAFGGMMFGIFSSDVRKSMHCKSCGYKW